MFRTYDAEILAGRAFDDADLNGEATPVVVNRRFVERLLENSSALGRRFHYRRPDPGRAEESYEIVGIVSDFPGFAPILGRDWEAKVYHPIAPGDLNPVTITVRLSRSLAPGFVGRFRQIGVEVDPAMPFDVQLLTDYYDEQLAAFRYINWVLALIMSSVLLLSAAGIHALMSFTVERRTREIGIRSALGAPADRILLSIFGRVVRQLAVGVGVGSLLSAMLFFIVESDPRRSAALLLSVAAIMSIVGLLAALGPARRGLRVQPTEALREGG